MDRTGPPVVWLVATQRSGSNLLRELMEGTGGFEDLDEVFRWEEDRAPLPHSFHAWLAGALAGAPAMAVPTMRNRELQFDGWLASVRARTGPGRVALADAKYNSCHALDPVWHAPASQPYLFELLRERGHAVVHLVRRNLLRTLVSEVRSKRSQVFHLRAGEPAPALRIELPVVDLPDRLRRRRAEIAQVRAWLGGAGVPTVEVAYEDLLDGARAFERVVAPQLEALGLRLPAKAREPGLRRIIPDPAQVVSNWAEVAATLRGGEFEALLGDLASPAAPPAQAPAPAPAPAAAPAPAPAPGLAPAGGILGAAARRLGRALGLTPRPRTPAAEAAAAEADPDAVRRAALEASPLFDPHWYAYRYPDVRRAGVAPAIHFLRDGDREGRDPHPFFSTAFYLEQRGQDRVPGLTAVEDYLVHGASRGIDPHPLFDTAYYLARVPEAGTSGRAPLLHFLEVGLARGLAPCRALEATADQDPDPDPAAGAFSEPDPTHPLPVWFAAPTWELSGVNTFTAALVAGLRRRGTDARLLVTDRLSARDQANLPDLPCDRLELGAGRVPDRWAALERFFAGRGPALLVPNYDFDLAGAAPILPARVGVVGILHSDDAVYYELAYRVGRWWDALVAVTPFIAARLGRENPALEARTRVIPYGIEDPAPAFPRAASDPGCLRLVYSGRLIEHQKRIRDLVGIARGLANRQVPFRLEILGDGPSRDELAAAFDREGLADRVFLRGRVGAEQVNRTLAASDALLLTSDFEGLPLALIEAMALGTVPVVSEVASGIPETLRDGVDGLKVPVGRTDLFAERLAGLHRDRAALAGLSRGTRARFQELGLSADRMAERYAGVFAAVAGAMRTGTWRRPAPLAGAGRYGRILLKPSSQVYAGDLGRLIGLPRALLPST